MDGILIALEDSSCISEDLDLDWLTGIIFDRFCCWLKLMLLEDSSLKFDLVYWNDCDFNALYFLLVSMMDSILSCEYLWEVSAYDG